MKCFGQTSKGTQSNESESVAHIFSHRKTATVSSVEIAKAVLLNAITMTFDHEISSTIVDDERKRTVPFRIVG